MKPPSSITSRPGRAVPAQGQQPSDADRGPDAQSSDAGRGVPSARLRRRAALAARAAILSIGSRRADVAELVDALDLGSSAARRGGSSPLIRTTCFALLGEARGGMT